MDRRHGSWNANRNIYHPMKKLLALASAAILWVAASLPADAWLAQVPVSAPSYTGPSDLNTFSMWFGTYAFTAAKRGTKAVNVCNVTNTTCVDVNSDATTGIVPNPSPGGIACDNTSTNKCYVFREIRSNRKWF